MKTKRIISIVALLAILLSGCANTLASQTDPTEVSFNTTVDETQLISERSPEQDATVSLISARLENILSQYALGEGIKYRGEEIQLYEPVTFSWKCEEENNGFTLVYTTKSDFSDAIKVDTKSKSVVVEDLFVATTYYWQVITHTADGDNYSEVYTFTTAQTPRVLSVFGVRNFRDIGGYVTEDGLSRVKQGMVYRGRKPDTIQNPGLIKMSEVYKIKTELDLRSPAIDTTFVPGTSSILGEDVNYVNVAFQQYSGALSDTEVTREAICLFADEENYPIYVHCSAGMDRTGTLMFIISALLGVPEEQVYTDYELTYVEVKQSNLVGYEKFLTFLEDVDKFEGDTLQQKVEALCKSIGITDEQIAAIRSIMLEQID